MKVGDVVRFIGFEKYRESDPPPIGIVIKIHRIQPGMLEPGERLTVLWPDGSIGYGLFPETLEVLSEGG